MSLEEQRAELSPDPLKLACKPIDGINGQLDPFNHPRTITIGANEHHPEQKFDFVDIPASQEARDRSPIVFFSGLAANALSYEAFLRDLSRETGRRILIVNASHGMELTGNKNPIDRIGKLYIEFIKYLKAQGEITGAVTFMGHSLGGLPMTDIANNHREELEGVEIDKIVFLESVGLIEKSSRLGVLRRAVSNTVSEIMKKGLFNPEKASAFIKSCREKLTKNGFEGSPENNNPAQLIEFINRQIEKLKKEEPTTGRGIRMNAIKIGFLRGIRNDLEKVPPEGIVLDDSVYKDRIDIGGAAILANLPQTYAELGVIAEGNIASELRTIQERTNIELHLVLGDADEISPKTEVIRTIETALSELERVKVFVLKGTGGHNPLSHAFHDDSKPGIGYAGAVASATGLSLKGEPHPSVIVPLDRYKEEHP